MPEEKRPTDRQLDAAIEGARDMVESKRSADPAAYRENEQRGGAGAMGSTGGTAQGAGTSTAGPSEMPTHDPSVETGGPRGAGYPPSRTSGGRLSEDDPPDGVDPEDAIKRSTSVRRKPEAESDSE